MDVDCVRLFARLIAPGRLQKNNCSFNDGDCDEFIRDSVTDGRARELVRSSSQASWRRMNLMRNTVRFKILSAYKIEDIQL